LGDSAQAAAPRDSRTFAAQAVSITGRNLITLASGYCRTSRGVNTDGFTGAAHVISMSLKTRRSEILVLEISNIVLYRS
jgi:hypothetical protein